MLFSIIIPTMWKSSMIDTMLVEYENSPLVGEVILIDNNPSKKGKISKFKKLRYHTRGENIYVNPSWNWGASLSKHKIILANDDIIIPDVTKLLTFINDKKSYDILGVSHKPKLGALSVLNINSFPSKGYGCFMYIKNYITIPEQFKIWYGDNILFEYNKSRGLIYNSGIKSKNGVTVEQFRKTICKDDDLEYIKFKKEERFNVIIRTSNRPNYYEKCIESIKKYNPKAKLHIVLDNIEDLWYVKKFTTLDYNYYIVNKDTISEWCSKVSIERKEFPFNYYFNIVKPFLNGFCQFLDDDDEVVSYLDLYLEKKKIYLHKVDIGIKIVPEKTFMKTPTLNDISGLSIVFHSSDMVDWTPQRGGDFTFITEMQKKCKTIWVDKVISKTQTIGNFGKKNDLKVLNKIAVCIPMYGRKEVTKFVFNHYNNLRKKLEKEVELILIACGSEGKSSLNLAINNGFYYIEYPNKPLSQKHNIIYEVARDFNPDACIKVDSDSIITIEFFKYYNDLINKGIDYSGILDIYFLTKNELCYWKGYSNHRKGETTGVGRFVSKKLLDALEWRLWGNANVDDLLDKYMTENVDSVKRGMNMTKTTCEDVGGLCIDIKTLEQITPFSAFTFDKIIPYDDFKEINFDSIRKVLLTDKAKVR